jgi:sugar phosphate permease
MSQLSEGRGKLAVRVELGIGCIQNIPKLHRATACLCYCCCCCCCCCRSAMQGVSGPCCVRILTTWSASKGRGTYCYWGTGNIAHNREQNIPSMHLHLLPLLLLLLLLVSAGRWWSLLCRHPAHLVSKQGAWHLLGDVELCTQPAFAAAAAAAVPCQCRV